MQMQLCGWFPALDAVTITPELQELHWLPVRRRVDFKMAISEQFSEQFSAHLRQTEDC